MWTLRISKVVLLLPISLTTPCYGGACETLLSIMAGAAFRSLYVRFEGSRRKSSNGVKYCAFPRSENGLSSVTILGRPTHLVLLLWS